MHATSLRGDYGIYEHALNELKPVIRDIFHEIKDLRKAGSGALSDLPLTNGPVMAKGRPLIGVP